MLFQLGVDLKRIYPPILDPPNGLAGVPNSRSSKQDGVKDLCFVGGGFVHGDTYTVYIYIDVKDYHTLHQQRGSWPWQSALQDSSDCDGHFGHAWCVAPRAAKQLPYHEA